MPGSPMLGIDIACGRCGETHDLEASLAQRAARTLIAQLKSSKGVVAVRDEPTCRRNLSNSRALFEPGGGKMFGCLVAQDAEGRRHELRAFSGMLQGGWSVPGFVEPVFDVGAWRSLEARYDPEIARLSTRIATHPDEARALRRQRAQLSRELMARYHRLYRLTGAAYLSASMEEVVGAGNMASGMGDCCAPKLLNAAHRRGWRAVSLVEFFVGESRRPGHRVHGEFYAPCAEKCGPLLSFLLCPKAELPDLVAPT